MDTSIKIRPEIALNAVESSQIEAIGHDPETNTLAIQFKSKSGPGSVYHYSNFGTEQFGAIKNAESIGSHFGKVIKPFPDVYPYEKIS
ncbi:MAG: KTSC domain-containing protein [Burkholderiales bacterium RIFCSPLOWO2_02_FULL_57_36]|nr:MAG: KTSC domain-containing protein [Burkholderiales bacterium RIFCSPLOWO2_02_FULL_57_36]